MFPQINGQPKTRALNRASIVGKQRSFVTFLRKFPLFDNICRVKIFAEENLRHLIKISSLFPDKLFPNKVVLLGNGLKEFNQYPQDIVVVKWG